MGLRTWLGLKKPLAERKAIARASKPRPIAEKGPAKPPTAAKPGKPPAPPIAEKVPAKQPTAAKVAKPPPPPPPDYLLQQMIACSEGDPVVWRNVSVGLRDTMVDFAERNCPFYRERLSGNGDRFESIPILTKTDIRKAGRSILAENVPQDRCQPTQTSGSTGQPMSTYCDRASAPLFSASRRFFEKLHGIPEDQITAFIMNGPPSGPSRFPVPMASLTPDAIAPLVRQWTSLPKRYWLRGYSSGIEFIAAECERQGLSASPSCAITSSDLLTDIGRERIARVFNCPVHSLYGSHEIGGDVAGTLPGTTRYAVNPLVVHAEILDEAGEPAPPGVAGRLVLTQLGNFAFPLIRYETGDYAAFSVSTELGGFPILERLEGRSSERIMLAGKKVLSAAHLGQQIIVRPSLADAIAGFQCAQVGDDAIELRVVWSTPDGNEAQLVEALRPAVNPTTEISIKSVGTLETFPSGKRWVLRDLRPEASVRDVTASTG